MKPIKPCPEDEHSITQRIRAALVHDGWTLFEKTHGDALSAGWPDLYCFKPIDGSPTEEGLHRWVEVKTPRGSFTPAQRARFARWHLSGLGVYVLCDSNIEILNGPPNWREWL